ncbi:MAG: hypothetical protein P8Y65_04055, partial [Campylobacterales bacterium]
SIVYSDAVGKVPFRTEVGAELAWHKSTDEHLVRSFYTVSEDLLYGYQIALDIGLYSDVSSELFVRADYRKLSGDATMEYYTEDGFHYNSLPASFENRSCSAFLTYRHRF